jgi:hypothetical protein
LVGCTTDSLDRKRKPAIRWALNFSAKIVLLVLWSQMDSSLGNGWKRRNEGQNRNQINRVTISYILCSTIFIHFLLLKQKKSLIYFSIGFIDWQHQKYYNFCAIFSLSLCFYFAITCIKVCHSLMISIRISASFLTQALQMASLLECLWLKFNTIYSRSMNLIMLQFCK